MKLFIKICGLTRLEDANAAIDFGASALGFIFAESPRKIPLDSAYNIVRQTNKRIQKIGVFANQAKQFVLEAVSAADLSGVQLHGNESCDFIRDLKTNRPDLLIIKAVDPSQKLMVDNDEVDYILFDSPKSVARPLDIQTALQSSKSIKKSFLIAGGLNSENVSHYLKVLRPHGVDISSAIESQPGVKDHRKMKEFFSSLKRVQSF